MRKVIGEGEESIGPLQGGGKRGFRRKITFREGDVISILQEFFRRRFTGIARQGTNLPSTPGSTLQLNLIVGRIGKGA